MYHNAATSIQAGDNATSATQRLHHSGRRLLIRLSFQTSPTVDSHIRLTFVAGRIYDGSVTIPVARRHHPYNQGKDWQVSVSTEF